MEEVGREILNGTLTLDKFLEGSNLGVFLREGCFLILFSWGLGAVGRGAVFTFVGTVEVEIFKRKFPFLNRKRLNFSLLKRHNSGNEGKVLRRGDLRLTDWVVRHAWVVDFYQAGGWHSRETLVVKHVGGDLTESCLTRFYTWATSLTSERTTHITRIVWCKGLLIDGLKDTNGAWSITQEVGTTSSIFSELGALVMLKALSGPCDTVLKLGSSG